MVMNTDQLKVGFCPFCGNPAQSLTKAATLIRCSSCDEVFEANPRPTQQAVNWNQRNFNYQSKWTLFGWPLFHFCGGIDPETGKHRVAMGLIASGEIAIGGFALGGLAIGGVAIGGVAIGLISLAGCAVGLLCAAGGIGLGLGYSIGGFAIGWVAVGGFAYGYYSLGGFAGGVLRYGGNFRDPTALEFFRSWRDQTQFIIGMLQPLLMFVIVAPLLLIPFIRNSNKKDELLEKTDKPSQPRRSMLGLLICVLLGSLTGVSLLWLVLVLVQVFS